MNKDLKIIVTGRIFQIIITLASIRVLTTFLSPEEVGNYYIVLSLLAFFNLVLLNPSGMYFSRHLLEWQRSKNLFNALFVFFVWMIIVAVLSIPISIFVYIWLGYETKFDLDIFLIYIFSAIIISTIHRNVLYGSNTSRFRKEFVIYLISTLILGLIFSTGIVYFYYEHALGWVLGVVLAEIIMLSVISNFFIQKNSLDINKIKLTLSKKRIEKILVFSLPIGITTFLMWGQNTAYRFLVDYQYSAEVLGYITIGLGVSSAVFSSIESIAMQYFNPIFLKNILDASKEERTKAWNVVAKQMIPIYILALFFTITMSEVLINILVDVKFHNSYMYTMFGAGIEFFRVITNLLSNVSQSEYKTIETIKPYGVGFIVSLGILSSINFGTNYFMIPVVLSLAYLFVCIYMYINMKKLLNIKFDIDLFKIIFLSIPFFMVFYLDLEHLNIVSNLLIIFVFGLYFLTLVLVWHKKTIRDEV